MDPAARSARRVIWQRASMALAVLAPPVAVVAQGPAVVPGWRTAQEVVVAAGLVLGAIAAVGASVWLWRARRNWIVPLAGSLLLAGWSFFALVVIGAMSFGEAMDGGRLLQTVPLDDGGRVFLFEDTGFLDDRPRTQVVTRKGNVIELRSPEHTEWMAVP